MRNIILTISILFSLGAFAQRESKVSDSTRFTKGVRFDSTLVFKRLKAAAAKDTVLVIMDANGTVSKINKSNLLSGISGGGTQTLSISGDTLSISDGNSVVLPVYVQADSSTISSYEVLNSQNAPPGSPSTGDVYLVGTSPTGAWVGHAKDIAEWNGSSWDFTDGVQGDFLYNATTALTYIFRSGNWVQTTGVPALNNGNNISGGLKIGTNNARSLTFETNNVNRGRFDSIGRYYIYDTSLRYSNKYIQVDSLTGRLIATEIPYNDGFIPLSGTEVGKPVTGDISYGIKEIDANKIFAENADGNISGLSIGQYFDDNTEEASGAGIFYKGLVSNANTGFLGVKQDGTSLISFADSVSFSSLLLDLVNVSISSDNASFKGINGSNDFSPNYEDLSYTQKIYVDQRISDTATQIRFEIPDVSNFATINNLADTSALLRSLIPATATFTILKNSAKDSIVTVFNGIRSAVKDSVANLTNYVTTSSTSTLTNKRITVRVDSTTSSATPTINTDNIDTYKLTAQALDITSFTTNLSGTPTDDQILHIVIIGTATRAITWGSKFEASTVALPTTTVSTNRLDVYFIWNTATSKWRCGGVW